MFTKDTKGWEQSGRLGRKGIEKIDNGNIKDNKCDTGKLKKNSMFLQMRQRIEINLREGIKMCLNLPVFDTSSEKEAD